MVRGIPVGVAIVAAALYFAGLGSAPFIDPPEGFHADVARTMATSGDWITPHPDGVRYFDKPPLLYWLAGLERAPGHRGRGAVALRECCRLSRPVP